MKYDRRNWEKPAFRIFLDCDGVICDFDTPRWTTYKDVKSTDDLPLEFWANLQWNPGGREMYDELCKLAPVTILTSPSNNGSSAMGKIQWINRELKTRDYLIGGCKWACAAPNHILVDNSIEKITRFISGGGIGVLHPRNSANVWTTINEVKRIIEGDEKLPKEFRGEL